MNKIIIFLAFLGFSVNIFSQVSEKPVLNVKSNNDVQAYSLKYDKASGSYIYSDFDTTTKKNTIYTPKASAGPYDFAASYDALFDKQGNVYSYAYNNLTDTTFTYFFLKNNDVITTYSMMNFGWIIKDGIIYFAAKDNDGLTSLIEYNTADGSFKKGKGYDDITFINYPEEQSSEGEPTGTLGFTKDGKTFYVASANNQKFIVIGGEEQKHYSDIDNYFVKFDNNGALTYIAKDQGKLYEERGNTFVVQGDKEYKKYDWVYGPILFDKNNNPVYIGADSAGNDTPQRVVIGSTEQNTYSGSIVSLQITPSGKIAYIASVPKDRNKTQFNNFLVIDGKESKSVYDGINIIRFLDNDVPLYSASIGADKTVLIKGDEKIGDTYQGILDANVLPNGKMCYVAVNYGNYDKKQSDKYYLFIGDNSFGPYNLMQMYDYKLNSYVLSDKAGNYAFSGGKLTNWKDYTYETSVYTNKGKSPSFDYVDYLKLYNGKPFFVASKTIDKKLNKIQQKIYYDNKPATQDYDSISDYKLDENTGVFSFIGSKGKQIYYVEVKL